MKILLLTLLFINVAQSSPLKPDRGLYVCETGNDDSICDQILTPSFSGNILSTITVEYVGWCGSIGPYRYSCINDVCEDTGLKFEFRDSTHYRWENKQYKIFCEFTKK